MNLDPIAQYQRAPEFEREQVTLAPAPTRDEPPDLAAMAIQLDQMKIEAIIEAERTRPGLNGFFALILITGASYVAAYLAQYQMDTVAAVKRGIGYLDVRRGLLALGIGLVAALVVGVWGAISARRTRRNVEAYERRLRTLGGTPLPERGPPPRGG